MEMIRKILAHNLIRLREARGLKQHQVAEGCGFETPTYNRWENLRAWPKPANIQALSEFYNIPSSEFFRAIEDAPAKPTLKEALDIVRDEMGISIAVTEKLESMRKIFMK